MNDHELLFSRWIKVAMDDLLKGEYFQLSVRDGAPAWLVVTVVDYNTPDFQPAFTEFRYGEIVSFKLGEFRIQCVVQALTFLFTLSVERVAGSVMTKLESHGFGPTPL